MTSPADADAAQKVPAAVRPVFDEITEITRAFCTKDLDAEYARLCGKLAGKLASKRPSPLLRGDRRIWAAGIVYATGPVNFLADPVQQPHLRTDSLAAWLHAAYRHHLGLKPFPPLPDSAGPGRTTDR